MTHRVFRVKEKVSNKNICTECFYASHVYFHFHLFYLDLRNIIRTRSNTQIDIGLEVGNLIG